MSDALIISQILLWLAVVGLGVIAIALARQVGVLHERIAPAGALAINKQIKSGDKAPKLTVQDLKGELIEIGGASEAGRSTFLFFLSPDCPVCKSLLPVVTSALKREADWVDGLFASDGGTPSEHEQIIAKHKLGHWPYVVSEILGRTLGVAKLPYAILIDEAGTVAAMGLVNSREHIESLFEAKARGVASIQEYLAERSG